MRSSDFLRASGDQTSADTVPRRQPEFGVGFLVRHGMKQEAIALLAAGLFGSDEDSVVSGLNELKDVLANQKGQIVRESIGRGYRYAGACDKSSFTDDSNQQPIFHQGIQAFAYGSA